VYWLHVITAGGNKKMRTLSNTRLDNVVVSYNTLSTNELLPLVIVFGREVAPAYKQAIAPVINCELPLSSALCIGISATMPPLYDDGIPIEQVDKSIDWEEQLRFERHIEHLAKCSDYNKKSKP
jgi:hypothetical protein